MDTVIEKHKGRAPAGLAAASCQMRRCNAKRLSEIRDIPARREIAGDQGRVARHELGGGGLLTLVYLLWLPRLQLSLHEDCQKAEMAGGSARVSAGFRLALNAFKMRDGLFLGFNAKQSEMEWVVGPVFTVGKGQHMAKDGGPDLDAVHGVRRDIDQIVGTVAAGQARDGDPALTLGDMDQARRGMAAHRFGPPARGRAPLTEAAERE